MKRILRFLPFIILLLAQLAPLELFAHVKWFTEGSYDDKPLKISEILSQDFYLLLALTLAAIALGVILDAGLRRLPVYNRLDSWLDRQKGSSLMIMRIAVGMTLILSWQADSMLVPKLLIKAEWIGWYQFLLCFLLIFPRTVPLAGLGLLLLYIQGFITFSRFYMLDYLLYFGVSWYLMVAQSASVKLRKSGLLLLYLTVGLSLCWVAIEKLIYPVWVLSILRENPEMALGLNQEFFITATAFIEFGLGFLLIISLLQRPLAVFITLVFFSTTVIFGKIEVIGHTLTHGALLVFLLEGGSVIYDRFNARLSAIWAKILVSVVAFMLLFGGLLYPYSHFAERKYENRKNRSGLGHEHVPLALPQSMDQPRIDLQVTKDRMSGYNLRFVLENFEFKPEKAGMENHFNEGHGHLYLNNEKIARIYGDWYHIPELPKGHHTLNVMLHANRHQMLTYNGLPIEDTEEIIVE